MRSNAVRVGDIEERPAVDVDAAVSMPAIGDGELSAPAADDLIDRVREVVRTTLAPIVEDIDRRGVYPATTLHALGGAGAFAAHLRSDADGYADAIRAIAEVSRTCGATGFMMWCQDVCGLYLAESNNPALTGTWLHDHAAGRVLGGTGMSNPMKTFAGIESMLLRARRIGDGYLVDGALPWVSNLGSDQHFGAVAALEGEPAGPDGAPREVMFIARCDDPGVSLRRCPEFSAMEGTSTWSVSFIGHHVGPERLVADPVRPFIGRIRAAFILLQCGMGLGVAQGAIDSMWSVERQLGHVNEFLDERPGALQDELDALTERTLRLAHTPFDTDREFTIDVLDARAHASEIALRAAQSALLHAGARGYLLSSAVQRRVRESHFVAIVTPAIKHLRKEIARLSAAELPA